MVNIGKKVSHIFWAVLEGLVALEGLIAEEFACKILRQQQNSYSIYGIKFRLMKKSSFQFVFFFHSKFYGGPACQGSKSIVCR